VVWLRGVCCQGCQRWFCLCSDCDRGQRYCSQECSAQARRVSLRAAGAKYQSSTNGRLNHAERQRRYRARQRETVTHQGYSPAVPASAIVGPVSLGEALNHEATVVDGGHAGADAHAVVVMSEGGRCVPKARLPHGPSHPQALQRLSEALAMWCGGPLRVVLAVHGPEAFCITRRWFATFDHLTRRPLYEIEFAQALPPPEDERRFEDVRQMLLSRMGPDERAAAAGAA